jgi:hypothetical protein
METGNQLATADRPRKVQEKTQNNSLFVNVPKTAGQIHDLEQGSPMTVVVCERGIWIEPINDE